jgi:hypothetical protein
MDQPPQPQLPPPLQLQSHPQPYNQSLPNWLLLFSQTHILILPSIKHLCPICPLPTTIKFSSLLNPETALNFFYFASEGFKFRFTVRSFCLLIHLLIVSNLVYLAILLLIRLLYRKLPCLYAKPQTRHIEIAIAMADFNSASKRVLGVQALRSCKKKIGFFYFFFLKF